MTNYEWCNRDTPCNTVLDDIGRFCFTDIKNLTAWEGIFDFVAAPVKTFCLIAGRRAVAVAKKFPKLQNCSLSIRDLLEHSNT